MNAKCEQMPNARVPNANECQGAKMPKSKNTGDLRALKIAMVTQGGPKPWSPPLGDLRPNLTYFKRFLLRIGQFPSCNKTAKLLYLRFARFFSYVTFPYLESICNSSQIEKKVLKKILQSKDTTASLFCCKMEIAQFLAKILQSMSGLAWPPPPCHQMSGFALPPPTPLWPDVIYG